MEIQITAIKFETVNGKKTGKSFAFKLDPKKMAVYKTEATVRKRVEEYVAKSGVFKSSELKDLKYSMKDFLEEWKKQVEIVQAEELAKLEESPNNPGSRITPDMITRLAPNEVFVFGSNEQGLHYGGAAKAAVENFGAIMGQGNGLQGKSYAIPSMSGLGVMGEYVKEFCEFAKAHPEKRFLVTPIGCGIAGYGIDEVAPLFECCSDVENITLPASFWDVMYMDMDRQLTINWQELRQFSIARWPKEMGTTHGVGHWDRVAKFGEMLYVDGVDMNVVIAFAYLHDVERKNDDIDDAHGHRASILVDCIRHNYLRDFDDEQVSLLKRACELHTLRHRTGNITIDTCFDADRLDLPRVGITPDPERMATSKGAKIASNPEYLQFYEAMICSNLG